MNPAAFSSKKSVIAHSSFSSSLWSSHFAVSISFFFICFFILILLFLFFPLLPLLCFLSLAFWFLGFVYFLVYVWYLLTLSPFFTWINFLKFQFIFFFLVLIIEIHLIVLCAIEIWYNRKEIVTVFDKNNNRVKAFHMNKTWYRAKKKF